MHLPIRSKTVCGLLGVNGATVEVRHWWENTFWFASSSGEIQFVAYLSKEQTIVELIEAPAIAKLLII